MKKVLSVLLVVSLFSSCLVGCGSEPVIQNPGDYGDVEVMDDEVVEELNVNTTDIMESVIMIENIGFDVFDSELINYVNNSDFQKENYCLSPLSIKLALALLVEGVNGETQQELLTALGVSSITELRDLSMKMNRISKEISAEGEEKLALYEKYPSMFSGEPPVSTLKINNSIWKNTNQPGLIIDGYKINIQEYYNGSSENVEAELLKDSINEWVDTNTRGMIPEIVGDAVKDSNIVLVNTLYLKDSWSKEFFDDDTVEKDFMTVDGDKVKKDFMCNQEDYLFYEDDTTKVLILETQSNIYVAFVLGDNSNIMDKIAKTTYEDTIVELPKMDIESSFDNGFLVDYLKTLGVDNVFDFTQADFSNMVEVKDGEPNVYVNDIIHKTKLTTDETGIEGAAATAVMIMLGAAYEEPKIPKEFIADKPFSFYVFTDNSDLTENMDNRFTDIDLLFYGQNVK